MGVFVSNIYKKMSSKSGFRKNLLVNAKLIDFKCSDLFKLPAKLFGIAVASSCFCLPALSMDRPVPAANVGARAQQVVRAPFVDHSFVNELKGLCSLVYGKLVDEDGTGLEALEREGRLSLFFRGVSRVEANFAGMVQKIENKLVIVFPGTRCGHFLGTTASDVVADVRYRGDDGGFLDRIGRRGTVHAGFAKEVMEFWPNLSACIARFSGYDEVFFTGHSKGGGIALLRAFKYAREHHSEMARCPNFVKVFTFSAPPVFSEELRSTFHKSVDGRNVVCIYKNRDAVPYSALPVGLTHVGIPANISFCQVPVDEATQEARFIVERLYGIYQGSSADAVALAQWAVTTIVNSHCLDGFSASQIREVMERMKANYGKNPYMDLNALGRNDPSSICSVM